MRANKMKRLFILPLAAAALYGAARGLFGISMCRGNKMCLAGFVNLDKEQRRMNDALKREKNAIDAWQKGVKHESWHISTDGAALYAQAFINDEGCGRWAVVAHGYGCDGTLMLYAAKRFYERGYNVLLPDLRAHGKSSGKYIGWGWKDRYDIYNWCSLIKKHDPNAKIVLYGVSMGAAAVLMAAGEKHMSGVRCVISDCSYTSLKDIISYRTRRMLHLPPYVVLCWLRPACRKAMGLSIDDASVLRQVKKCSVPLMFCHGDRDRFVPTDNALELYSAARVPKRLMLVHGAGHGVSAFVGGDKYWNSVFEFADMFER